MSLGSRVIEIVVKRDDRLPGKDIQHIHVHLFHAELTDDVAPVSLQFLIPFQHDGGTLLVGLHAVHFVGYDIPVMSITFKFPSKRRNLGHGIVSIDYVENIIIFGVSRLRVHRSCRCFKGVGIQVLRLYVTAAQVHRPVVKRRRHQVGNRRPPAVPRDPDLQVAADPLLPHVVLQKGKHGVPCLGKPQVVPAFPYGEIAGPLLFISAPADGKRNQGVVPAVKAELLVGGDHAHRIHRGFPVHAVLRKIRVVVVKAHEADFTQQSLGILHLSPVVGFLRAFPRRQLQAQRHGSQLLMVLIG